MVYLRVVAALAWLCFSGALLIVWSLDEAISGIGQAMIAFAVVYVLCSLVLRAADAVEAADIRRHRHLDRRPQI